VYDGVTTELDDRGTWPPMPVATELVELALGHARDVGLAIGTERSGGVSDGCWTGRWCQIRRMESRHECQGRTTTA
jgi:hypothetical protein